MMNTHMKLAKPGSLELTLTMTMPLHDWLSLREQLTNAFPSWQLSKAIRQMADQVTSTFYPDDEADGFAAPAGATSPTIRAAAALAIPDGYAE